MKQHTIATTGARTTCAKLAAALGMALSLVLNSAPAAARDAEPAPVNKYDKAAACAEKAREAGVRGKLKRSAFMSDCVGKITDEDLARMNEANMAGAKGGEKEHGHGAEDDHHRRGHDDDSERHRGKGKDD